MLDLSHKAEKDIKRRFSLTLSGLPDRDTYTIFKENSCAVTDLSLLKIKVLKEAFAVIHFQ